MRIAVITANMGSFEKTPDHIEQSVPIDFYTFSDENFPPRYNSMTPRLQARIVKMFTWQMIPDYDYYVWIDSSMTMTAPNAVEWLLEKLGNADIACFKHPDRNTIEEEYKFVEDKLSEKHYYLWPRYANEFLYEQLREVKSDKSYEDNLLIASTIFIYKNSQKMRDIFKEWWYHTSRYTTEEQLSLPYVLRKCKVNLIDEHYMKTPYFTYTRNK